jgi:hypothetical protein
MNVVSFKASGKLESLRMQFSDSRSFPGKPAGAIGSLIQTAPVGISCVLQLACILFAVDLSIPFGIS